MSEDQPRKRAPGGGRKLHPVPLVRFTVTITEDQAAYLRSIGAGKISAGIRALVDRTLHG